MTGHRGLRVGVINTSPDSYFDASFAPDIDSAVSAARKHIREGADYVEIGGLSGGSAAKRVDTDKEMRRTLPVIEAVVAEFPAIVDESKLTRRNSWMSGMYSTTQIGGPSLAGLLVQALGAAYALVVDAISYLASAVVLSTLPEHQQARPEQPDMVSASRIQHALTRRFGGPSVRP